MTERKLTPEQIAVEQEARRKCFDEHYLSLVKDITAVTQNETAAMEVIHDSVAFLLDPDNVLDLSFSEGSNPQAFWYKFVRGCLRNSRGGLRRESENIGDAVAAGGGSVSPLGIPGWSSPSIILDLQMALANFPDPIAEAFWLVYAEGEDIRTVLKRMRHKYPDTTVNLGYQAFRLQVMRSVLPKLRGILSDYRLDASTPQKDTRVKALQDANREPRP